MVLCNVETCSNKSGSPGVRTVSFPANPEIRRKWIDAIDNKTKDISSVKYPRICSAHFPTSCWDFFVKPPALVAGSVPSIFCRCPSSQSSSSGNTGAERASVAQRDTPTCVGRTSVEKKNRRGRPKRIDKINHRRECPFYLRHHAVYSRLQNDGPENLDPNAPTPSEKTRIPDQLKLAGGSVNLAVASGGPVEKVRIPRTPNSFVLNCEQEHVASTPDSSGKIIIPSMGNYLVIVHVPRTPDSLMLNSGLKDFALKPSEDLSGKNRIPGQLKQNSVPENLSVSYPARLNNSSRKKRNSSVPDSQLKLNDELENYEQGTPHEKLSMFWFDSL